MLFLGFLALLVFTVDGAFREASNIEFPFHVSVQDAGKKEHICGGVIITPKWVLTSALCVAGIDKISVAYGSVRLSEKTKCVRSTKIEHEPMFLESDKNRLAAIKVESPIQITPTSSQAVLASCCAKLQNRTKLSGWKMKPGSPAILYVSDNYSIITDKCPIENLGGATVKLATDEFCGMDEEKQTKLVDIGSLVSVKATVLGMLTYPPAGGMPPMFMRLSNHEQWIKSTLGPDADAIKWVGKLPSDSSSKSTSIVLLGISTFLLRLI